MRRQHFPSPKHQKPFINSYHVCEVPLPYYNPLGDPHLRGHFSNQKVGRHINGQGLIYSPSKGYAYHERRTTNFHKHLKDNLCKVPQAHQTQSQGFEVRSYIAQSQRDLSANQKDNNLFSMPSRKAGSQVFGKSGSKWAQLNDIVSRRPDNQAARKRNLSPSVRSKSNMLERRKNYSGRRREGENAQEIDLLL